MPSEDNAPLDRVGIVKKHALTTGIPLQGWLVKIGVHIGTPFSKYQDVIVTLAVTVGITDGRYAIGIIVSVEDWCPEDFLQSAVRRQKGCNVCLSHHL